MKLLRYAIALAIVSVVSSLINWKLPVLYIFDLYLVAVMVAGFRLKPMSAQFFGVTAGLLQDSLSGGIIGINAISKAVIGYAISNLQRSVLIRNTSQQAIVMAAASVVDIIIVAVIHSFFSLNQEISLFALLKIALNTIIGLGVLWLMEYRLKLRGADQGYEES